MLVNNVGGFWNATSPRTVTSAPSRSTTSPPSCSPTCYSIGCSTAPLRESSPCPRTRTPWGGSTSTTCGKGPTREPRPTTSPSSPTSSSPTSGQRLHATTVTANALHPGVVRTAFGAEDPASVQRFLIPVVRPFMKSPTQGAATSIHVASAPELRHVSGRYFANRTEKKSAERTYDQAVAAQLWRVSTNWSTSPIPDHGWATDPHVRPTRREGPARKQPENSPGATATVARDLCHRGSMVNGDLARLVAEQAAIRGAGCGHRGPQEGRGRDRVLRRRRCRNRASVTARPASTSGR